MTQAQETLSINPTLVNESARVDTIHSVFGSYALRFESLTYSWMKRLNKEYDGGYWNYYTLSNNGFYMAPSLDKVVHMSNAENWFEGAVTPDAAGIIASLFAANQLCNQTAIDEHIELYYALREYAKEHPEHRLIFKAID
jgi:Antirestriction protein